MSLATDWLASVRQKPAPANQIITGTVERFSGLFNCSCLTGFLCLIENHVQTFTFRSLSLDQRLALTQPGDSVSMEISEVGTVVGLVNHTLAARLKHTPTAG